MGVRVNLLILMERASQQCESTTITCGFQLANLALARIAERAYELGDKSLCDHLYTLGYVDGDGRPLQPAWVTDRDLEEFNRQQKRGTA
jgi:hypothetical protein